MPSSVVRLANEIRDIAVHEPNDHRARRSYRRRPSRANRLGDGQCDDPPLTGSAATSCCVWQFASDAGAFTPSRGTLQRAISPASAGSTSGILSPRNWVTEFIEYVRRRSLSERPDSVSDTARDMYLEWSNLDPCVAAESVLRDRRVATPLVRLSIASAALARERSGPSSRETEEGNPVAFQVRQM